MLALAALALTAVLLPDQQAPAEPGLADAAVTAAAEELRKAELMLDADALAGMLAQSFTLIQDGDRLSGSVAFVEPLRSLRDRRGEVREYTVEALAVRVYGASAVTTYRFRRVWVDQKVRHREEGWSSDVWERRDDGAWILVHRHRSR